MRWGEKKSSLDTVPVSVQYCDSSISCAEIYKKSSKRLPPIRKQKI
jgi:hypothetical protein